MLPQFACIQPVPNPHSDIIILRIILISWSKAIVLKISFRKLQVSMSRDPNPSELIFSPEIIIMVDLDYSSQRTLRA